MGRHYFAGLLLGLAALAAHAEDTPVGLWKTIDDETGQEKSLVRIVETGGVVSGRIEKLLNPSKADPVCEKCTDDRKDKPIVGLSIIEGLRRDGDVWSGGRILDPNNGKIYTVRLKPVEDGRKLQVRGYIGPFFRTQTWLKAD